MNRLAAVLAAVLCAALDARAESIGIRFIVSQDLGSTAAQQQQTRHMLAQYVAGLNERYRNSEINLTAEVVQIEFSRITSTNDVQIIGDMEQQRNGFEALFSKAYTYGADYTVAMVGKLLINGEPGCGRAYAVNQSVEAIADPRKAFAVVNFFCGAHTLAHELGHLMGLNHGTQVDSCNPNKGHTSAITPYANGYATGNCDGKLQPGEFGDIMVGGHMRAITGNDKSNLPLFSNPRLHDARCGFNQTCGDPLTGDAARALNENAHYYASHKTHPAAPEN